MVNTIIKDFIEHNNKLVEEWMENPSAFCNNNVYFRHDRTLLETLSEYGLPEPYLGNPNRCSAVIININPGGVMKDYNCLCTKERPINFINRYLMPGQYESYAHEFPYLTLPEKKRGTNWWISRNAWIEYFLSIVPIERKEEGLYPFAIELCPWHSDKWKGMRYDNTELKAYINQYVIKPAGEAIKNSKLPFGLGVGTPIIKALKELDFITEEEWTWETTTLEQWPINSKGRIKRGYVFLRDKTSSSSFLCTWAQGGNKAPSKVFQKIEKEIYEIIQNKFYPI